MNDNNAFAREQIEKGSAMVIHVNSTFACASGFYAGQAHQEQPRFSAGRMLHGVAAGGEGRKSASVQNRQIGSELFQLGGHEIVDSGGGEAVQRAFQNVLGVFHRNVMGQFFD